MAHLIIGNKKEKAVWYSDNDDDGTSNKHWMSVKSVKYLLFYNIIRGFYDTMVVVFRAKNRSIRLRRIVSNAKNNKLLINNAITFYF